MVGRVWAYTGDKTQWQVSLLKLPRSVGRSVGWFLDLNSERKEVHEWNASGMQDNRYGLRWVCTYGTSHPGRWSALESIDRYCLRLSARKEGTSFALGLRRVGHVVWVRRKEVTPVKLRVLRSVESEEGSWDHMDIR